MKNVYIINEVTLGSASGIGTYLTQYLKCLDCMGYFTCRIELNSTQTEFCIVKESDKENYLFPRSKNLHITLEYYINVIRILRLYIKDSRNNVFHINYTHTESLVDLLRKYYPLSKIILTIHYIDWTWMLKGNIDEFKNITESHKKNTDPTKIKVIESHNQIKKLCKKVDHVIVLSKDTFNYINDIIDADKISLILNGLFDCDVNKLNNNIEINKEKYHINKNEILLLFVGRPDRMKGLGSLIKSFTNILNEYPDSRLIIVGSVSNYLDELMKECKNTWSKIIITGKLSTEELYLWYQIADIGIIPSYTEQCSYVGIEMMMHGLPIAASNGFGVRNMFIDNQNAVIAPIEDYNKEDVFSNNLKTAIIKLLFDRDLYDRIKRRSREVYQLNYTFEKMKYEYEMLFNNL